MNARTRRLLKRGAQLVVLALVAWFVLRALRGQWDEFRRVSGSLDPNWPLLVGSGALVLGAYGMLIDVWRRLVAVGGAPLPFWRAARIWFVSSLGKYVPGKLWSIAAMGAMAQREGVSPGVAASAAILNQAVNLAAGFAVVAATGARVIPHLYPGGGGRLAIVVAAAAGLGMLALPTVLPRAVGWAARRLGRPAPAELPPRTLWYAIAVNLLAWVLYGVAFHIFAIALGAGTAGGWAASVAVFTVSYLLGYLALFAPGGLVVREGAMVAALTGLGLTSAPQATLLAVASRLWLTVLEIAPGALFLVRDAAPRSSQSPST